MKIVIIWARFGPYHLARLEGAAVYGKSHGLVVEGIEVARDDDVYE